MVIFWVIFLCFRASSQLFDAMTINLAPPEERNGVVFHGFYRDKLFMFGGKNFDSKFNDVYLYNLDSPLWERYDMATGILPSNYNLGPRSEATIVDYNLGSEFLFHYFGGIDEFGYRTDLWMHDMNTRNWFNKGEIYELYGLAEYAACSSNGILYVYGGRTYSSIKTELWV